MESTGRPELKPRALRRRILLLALILVFGGGYLAWRVQTAGGTVRVEDVRFMGDDGTMMSGLLYVPPNASAESPAPGILAIHGYINSRETQSGFAIEFARRGFVVLALDQTGHGFSDPPAFAQGLGGPAGLEYLRSLDIVDPDNVGLEGHSMGGTAVLAAAAAHPEGYRAVVPVGAAVAPRQTVEGEPLVPRNLAVVFSVWDEFSDLMWSVPVAPEMVGSERLMELFGTDEPVEVDRLYGDPAVGTGRVLRMPRTTHPGDHLSTEAIGDAVAWMQRVLEGEQPLPPEDQIWYWKEIGTFLAFLGMLLAVFPLGAMLLQTPYFSGLRSDPAPARGMTGGSWWIGAGLTLVIPVLTYYGLQNLGTALLEPNAFWPQSVTTGIVFWALGNAVITAVLFGIWHFGQNRKTGAGAAEYGLWLPGTSAGGSAGGASSTGRMLWRSVVLAGALAGFCYLLLTLSDFFYQTDFRFWVLALKPMGNHHVRIFLAYLPALLLFFVVLGVALHGQMRRRDESRGRAMLRNAALLSGGFVALLLFQYVPLLMGGTLPLGEPLLTIVAIQFVPLLIIIGLVSTYFFHKTGRIWVGAFFNAFFVTWYIVAGQATHVAM